MEKIKISLSKYTYEILTKDMENFEIVKDNGGLNKNEFLNRLIINYTDTFSNESKEQIERIDTIIDRYVDLDEIDKINLSNELVKSFRENMFFHDIDGTSVIVSVKPTKMSEPIITYLFDEVIQNQSSYGFDDNDKRHEVRMDRCRYICVWETENGAIELRIEHNGMVGCYVFLLYVDSENESKVHSSAIDDL